MQDSSLSAERGKGSTEKPSKPRADFPLFPHATKRWAKKYKGKTYYFGPWSDPDGAEAAYFDWKAVYIDGKPPRPTIEAGPTVADICNHYLTAQEDKLPSGKLSQRGYLDSKRATDLLVATFDKNRPVKSLTQADFAGLLRKFAKKSLAYQGNIVARSKAVFNFAYKAQLIEHIPRFGPGFEKPDAKVMKRHKGKAKPKTFTAAEVWQLLDATQGQLHAMLWLGINAGLGPSDVGQLERRHIDFKGGWLDYYRPKTGEKRRSKLWPETLAAIRAVEPIRPKPKQAELDCRIFLTRCGESWHREHHDTPIANEAGKLIKRLGLAQKGRGFYGLRHTFATVASQGGDLAAVQLAMGHNPNGITQGYIDQAATEASRLEAIAQRVHDWLMAGKPSTEGGQQ